MTSETAILEPPRIKPPRIDPPKQITTTIKGAAAMTGLGLTKINELIGKRKLKSVCVGRRRLVFVDSIEALLNAAAEKSTSSAAA
jgi:excisionase family DNA binding protein